MPLLFRSNQYVDTETRYQWQCAAIQIAYYNKCCPKSCRNGAPQHGTNRFQYHTACMGFTLWFNINLTIGACALAVNVWTLNFEWIPAPKRPFCITRLTIKLARSGGIRRRKLPFLVASLPFLEVIAFFLFVWLQRECIASCSIARYGKVNH